MKKKHLLATTITVVSTFFVYSYTVGSIDQNSLIAKDDVTISISSSNSDSTVIFETLNVGEWMGTAPADSQSTPFEFTVAADNFHGTIHKIDGNSRMIIKLVAKKGEEKTWEIKKEYDRICQIILDENYTSIDGK